MKDENTNYDPDSLNIPEILILFPVLLFKETSLIFFFPFLRWLLLLFARSHTSDLQMAFQTSRANHAFQRRKHEAHCNILAVFKNFISLFIITREESH